MTYIKLIELSTKGQARNIKVKAMRLWESINNKIDEIMSMDMIVMDEQVYPFN
jgi:hypothetical protein